MAEYTILSRSRRLRRLILGFSAFVILALTATAQDTTLGVPVRITAWAQTESANGELPFAGTLDVAAQVLPSTDYPTGSFHLVGSGDSGGNGPGGVFYAHPSDVTETDLKLPQHYARMLPGRVYRLIVNGTRLWNNAALLSFSCPGGYQLEVDGMIKNSEAVSTAYGPSVIKIRVLDPTQMLSARAGTASSISSGKIFWQVALGGLKNGGSAGALALADAGTDVNWSSIFTPAGLQYQQISTEVVPSFANGNIRQVLGNEACVDVVTLSTTSYELRFYTCGQMQGTTAPRSFIGFPFVTYRIERDGSDTKLKITSERRQLDGTFTTNAPATTTVIGVSDTHAPVKRTAVTTLERTGTWANNLPAYVWNLQDWNTASSTTLLPVDQQVEEARTWGGTTAARTEAVKVRVPNAVVPAQQVSRTFAQHNWGEAVAQEIVGTSNSVTTDYEYYSDSSQIGSYGAIKSVSSTGNAWEAYEYDANNYGVITRRHRPYQNSPSAAPSDLSASADGEITSFSYTTDAFGALTRPTLIQTKVNGTTTASANISYAESILSTSNHSHDMYVVTATRSDQTDSTSSHLLTTVTKYFREDTFDDFYRGQIHSIQRPDDTKQVFAYQRGTWSGTAFTISGNNGLDAGPASRIVVITGSAPTGTNDYSSYDDYAVDPIHLIVDASDSTSIKAKSTMQVTIRDSLAHVVRTETQAWNGTTWVSVASVDYNGYDLANQLTSTQASNGALYSASYSGELKQWEQDPAGNKVSYTYDPAGRVDTATQDASVAPQGGTAAIAALTTKYAYNALGQVTTQTVGFTASGSDETMVSSRGYDDAGRVTSESSPGANLVNGVNVPITTFYAYAPDSRQVTITLPNGGTHVETYQPDGSLAQVTGTADVHEYYTYGVSTTDGSHWARVNLGTAGTQTDASLWDTASLRQSQVKSDWLGRAVQSSRPGFTGQVDYVAQNFYDNGTGRLSKTSRTGFANTLYEYDGLSQVTRTGLRLGGTTDTLSLASADRITDSDQYLENTSGAWWMTKIAKTYPTATSNATRTVSTVRQRLTGLGGSFQAESISIDVDGNTTDRTTTVDRTNKTVTISITATGYTNAATQTIDNGFTTSTTGSDGITYTTAYDALHRRTTSTDPRSSATNHIVTTLAYKTGSAFVDTVTDADGKTIATYTYDTAGRVIAVKDAANNVTRTDYDVFDRVIRQWGGSAHPVEYVYDDLGQRKELHTYQDDALFNSATTWPTVTPTSVTKWTYDDPSGLLWKKTDAAQRVVEFAYNQRGQVKTRKWARALSATDSTKVTTTYAYYGDTTGESATGELHTVSYNDGTPGVSYTYTRLGQILTASDGVTGERTFDYGVGTGSHALQLDDIELGGFYNSRVLTRLYDGTHRPAGFDLGDLTRGLSADMAQVQHYNGSGLFDYLDTTPAGQTIRRFTYKYDVTNSSFVGGYKTGVSGTNLFETTRGYDPKRDLLASLDSQWNGATQTRYDYTYNALGQRKTATQSGSAFSDLGTTTYDYRYNGRGELEDAADYLGGDNTGAQLSGRHHAFTYDAAGNRQTASRTGTAGSPDHYTPNALNQYDNRENNVVHVAGTVSATTTAVTAAGGTTAPSVTFGTQGRYWAAQVFFDNYAHDGIPAHPKTGNITVTAAKPVAGGSPLVVAASRTTFIPASPQIFSYDEDGNLKSDGVWVYTYDAENRLVRMVTDSAVSTWLPFNRELDFAYDYLGRRVQKRVLNLAASGAEVSSRRYLYDGDNLVAEFNAPGGTSCGSLVRSYTWGLDLAGSTDATGGVGALLQITDHSLSTAKTFFPTYDGNGNVAALLDAADGTLAAKYEYSPFGELLRCEGTYAASNPFRFSTKFTDDETGLVYYGARYYSPSLGRFVNRDPIEEAGGLNLYGFCGNDGVNGYDYLGMVDPIVMEPFIVTGTKIGAAFGPVGAAIGGAIGAVVGLFTSNGIFGKLFGGGGGGSVKAPPKPATIVRSTTYRGLSNPDPLQQWRFQDLGDGVWVEANVFEGGMMEPFVVSGSRLPSLASMFMAAMDAVNPVLGLARGIAEEYRSNLKLGGGHFNALNMTFNPAYMAMSGFTETFSGLGMDAHDLGLQLTGWGRTRALAKGLIGTVGTVAAATGVTVAGSNLVRTIGSRLPKPPVGQFGPLFDNRSWSGVRAARNRGLISAKGRDWTWEHYFLRQRYFDNSVSSWARGFGNSYLNTALRIPRSLNSSLGNNVWKRWLFRAGVPTGLAAGGGAGYMMGSEIYSEFIDPWLAPE